MMLVKTHVGDGVWRVWQATGDVMFLGSGSTIEVPDGDHDYWTDERFRQVRWDHLYAVEIGPTLDSDDNDGPPLRLMRWANWTDLDSGEQVMLVTDGPIFICNAAGDTVEALR